MLTIGRSRPKLIFYGILHNSIYQLRQMRSSRTYLTPKELAEMRADFNELAIGLPKTGNPEIDEAVDLGLQKTRDQFHDLEVLMGNGVRISFKYSEPNIESFNRYKRSRPELVLVQDPCIGRGSYFFQLDNAYIEGDSLYASTAATVRGCVLIGVDAMGQTQGASIIDSHLSGWSILDNASGLVARNSTFIGERGLQGCTGSYFLNCEISSDVIDEIRGCIFINCKFSGLHWEVNREKLTANNYVFDGVPENKVPETTQPEDILASIGHFRTTT